MSDWRSSRPGLWDSDEDWDDYLADQAKAVPPKPTANRERAQGKQRRLQAIAAIRQASIEGHLDDP